MKLIGLTGGIGSGKSTVAGIFRTYGIPVFESDSIAKSIMSSDQQVKDKIIELLGPNAYDNDYQLNRKWIASEVFSDSDKLDKLNAIVHPAVYSALIDWASGKEQLVAPYLIQESAIIFEEDLTARLKAIILVVAEQETRISRVMARDAVTRDHILKRIQQQWPDTIKLPLSDFVIYNDAERPLISQIQDIDLMIRSTIIND